MKIHYFLATLLLGWSCLYAHDIVPGSPQNQPIALVGGTVHPVSGPAFSGKILFEKGKIVALGQDITIPENAQVIDVTDKHVYPGLISANSSLGLVEISAVRASRDLAETGKVNPNSKARLAFNIDSEIIPTVRSNGVLCSLIVPQGSLFRGTSSVMMLDGWNYEDALLQQQVGVHLNWPRMRVIEAWWMDKTAEEQKKDNQQKLEVISETLAQAKRYAKAKANTPNLPVDLRWEALLPIVNKQKPLFIHARGFRQIEAAIDFAKKEDLKIVLVGGADAHYHSKQLKENNIPVILQSTYHLPRREDEAYDMPYRLANLLRQQGVQCCLALGEGGSYWRTRNLAFQAGNAVAYGLSQEEALKAITLWPAQILGIADKVGSLEVGKDATLVVCSGNILEIKDQDIEQAYIQGRKVDLDNKHKRLYRKYKQRYEE